MNLSWALERDRKRFFDELRLDIPVYFLPTKDPAVSDTYKIIKDHLNNVTNIQPPFINWSAESYLKTGDGLSISPLEPLKRAMRSILYSKN